MRNKFYAIYDGNNDVLVFDSADERDEFVLFESLVHPNCRAVGYDGVKDLIAGKTPVFDSSFGCLAILN